MNLLKRIFLDGEIFISQKVLKTLCYIILPIVLIAMMYISYQMNGMGGIYELSEDLGSVGFYVFVGVLYISPLRAIFPEFKILTKLVAYRRQLGIATFYILLAHGLGLMFAEEGFYYLSTLLTNWRDMMFWGIFSLGIMFMAYITSNNFAVRLLKKNWKRIQRLTYIAFFFAVIHTALIEHYTFAALFAGFFVLKFLAYKKVQCTFFAKQ